MDTLTPSQRAAQAVGGVTKLAEVAGVSVEMASQWVRGRRPIPPKYCPSIALASGVKLDELCPAMPWRLVPSALQQAAWTRRHRQMG